ncbi:hypothetical protein MB09_07585 [Aequorivita vladivostokensis]|uniref:Uncharacterized protein n=1 Tax=Aequorivita vladivostokensis TaxID=171194 RepID=A0ABR5DIE5_9FLAO|nr:hypothetical protein MB09_07585 [Aequorivita vladivostokensis]
MVDLGQKKADTCLPFFMSQIFGVASSSVFSFYVSEIQSEPFPLPPETLVCLFLYPNLNGVASHQLAVS